LHLKNWAALATSSTSVVILITTLSLAVVTGIIIAGSLSFYLHKSRSGVESTDTVINKLMIHAVHNGILTSIVGIILLVLVTTERNLVFFSVFQILGSLYTNPMIATLNARHSLAQTGLPSVSVPSQAIAFRVLESATTLQTKSFHRLS